MLNPVSWEPCFAARPVWQGLGGRKVSLKTRYFRLSCFTGWHWRSLPVFSCYLLYLCCVKQQAHSAKVKGKTVQIEIVCMRLFSFLLCELSVRAVRALCVCLLCIYVCVCLCPAYYVLTDGITAMPFTSWSAPLTAPCTLYHLSLSVTQLTFIHKYSEGHLYLLRFHVSSARPYKNVSPCFIEQSYNVL